MTAGVLPPPQVFLSLITFLWCFDKRRPEELCDSHHQNTRGAMGEAQPKSKQKGPTGQQEEEHCEDAGFHHLICISDEANPFLLRRPLDSTQAKEKKAV